MRDYCSRALDPLVDSEGFDFVADLGAIMPMRTIGFLLGIPEEGQQQIRDLNDKRITLAEGVVPSAPRSSRSRIGHVRRVHRVEGDTSLR